MENLTRKKRNREIERAKKRQRNLFVTGIMAVVVVIVLAISWVVWDVQNRQWIMTFEGERISISDFMFLATSFEMFAGPEMARDFAMTELLNTLVSLNRAEIHGVGITDEEMEELIGQAEGQMQWMQIDFITAERIAELWGAGNVQNRLMDIYVPEYTPDPIEFLQELTEYIDENIEDYSMFEVKYVIVETAEDAAMVFELSAEQDFDDLVREHSIYYDEEFGVTTFDVREFIDQFMIGVEDSVILMNMNEGDRHVTQVEDYFIVIYMYDRSEPDMDEMEANFREQFILERRFEEFRDIRQGWLDESVYTINQRAYDAL